MLSPDEIVELANLQEQKRALIAEHNIEVLSVPPNQREKWTTEVFLPRVSSIAERISRLKPSLISSKNTIA